MTKIALEQDGVSGGIQVRGDETIKISPQSISVGEYGILCPFTHSPSQESEKGEHSHIHCK